MSNKAPKQPSLNKLQKEWYKKLKDEGFVDIEKNEEELRVYHSSASWQTRYWSSEGWIAKRDYYQFAEHFLSEYRFDNELDKVIWEYHVTGISFRNIVKILEAAGMKETSKSSIHRTLDKLRKSMFSMYLLPKVTAYHE